MGTTGIRSSNHPEFGPLHTLSLGRGLADYALRLIVWFALFGVCVVAWNTHGVVAFTLSALLFGLWSGIFLCLHHDALHATLTGRRGLDTLLGRSVAWVCGWPFETYRIVHMTHHWVDPVNGPKDPEYLTALTKKQCLALFLFGGGTGFLMHLYRGVRSLGRGVIATALKVDVLGIVFTQSTLTAVGYLASGTVLFWPVVFVFVERAMGWVHFPRLFVEHGALPTAVFAQGTEPILSKKLDQQALSSRTVKSGALNHFVYHGLQCHGAHHAFPGIPWFALPQAQRLLNEKYVRAGKSPREFSSYGAALIDVYQKALE